MDSTNRNTKEYTKCDINNRRYFILSVLLLIVSFFTMCVLLLTFYSKDIGILLGKAEIQADIVKNRITIINGYYGLNIAPVVQILNKGKQPEFIGDMLLYLSSPKMKQIFVPVQYYPYDGHDSRPFSSFVLPPESVWNARVSFSKKLTETEDHDICNFQFQTLDYFQKMIVGFYKNDLYKKMK